MSSRFSFDDLAGKGTVQLDSPISIEQQGQETKIDFISFNKPGFQFFEKVISFKSCFLSCMGDIQDKMKEHQERYLVGGEEVPQEDVPQPVEELTKEQLRENINVSIEGTAATMLEVPVASLSTVVNKFKDYIDSTKKVTLGNTQLPLNPSYLNEMQESDVFLVLVALNFFLKESSTIKSKTGS